jgi:NDP-sugar pyrophosphorylase family protein
LSKGAQFPTTIILAGGLGTRLGPVSRQSPKCLMPVADQPFIAHQLRLLRREGVNNVVLCLGHLGEQVRDYVRDGSAFDLSVKYVFDGERLLGTGGAIGRVIESGALEQQDHFALIYGDSYLDVPFAPIYETFVRSGKPALMTVLLNENRWDKSNVVMRDGMIVVYDKKNQTPDMRHIDFGLLIFSRQCFAGRNSDQPFDLSILLQELVSVGHLAAFEVTQRFYEIGTPDSLAETDQYIRSKTLRPGLMPQD